MESFLHKVAKTILSNNLTGPDSVIILPNRRSEVFLKNELKKITDHSIWLPEFYPVDKFFQRISGHSIADQISLSLHLYSIHKELEGNNARQIDDFLSWTPIIISDFNDIDNAMASPDKVYQDLSAIKEMEHWDPSRNPLTNLQKEYLRFYKSMIKYYNYLNEIMLKKNSGYSGFINKQLAQNLNNINIPWDKILVAGLNAFSEAEIQIFDHLNQNYNATFMWDIDNYYMHNTYSGVENEAGSYIKYILKRLRIDLPIEIPDYISETEKKVKLIASQKNISQVKFIGQEIESLKEEEFEKTAIILGNESLIVPLLHSLPVGNNYKYNITLGYPLINSQSEFFILTLLDILELRSRITELPNNDLITFLRNITTKEIIGHSYSDKIVNELLLAGVSNINEKVIHNILLSINDQINPFLNTVLFDTEVTSISQTLGRISQSLTDSVDEIKSGNKLFLEEFKTMVSILSRIIVYIKDDEDDFSYSSIKKIAHQLFTQSTVDIIGEPLKGIQIMGMLESRALDFKNIFFLSANEGMIPKTSSFDSFIPWDLRRKNNLPLPSYKTGIYAYHFFRLFQRSSNFNLIYNNSLDDLGSGEKSRFILQIEDEIAVVNKNISIEKKIISTETSSGNFDKRSDNLRINKNHRILKDIKSTREWGYSASRLTTYLTCSLKFYFSYILKLKPEVLPDQIIEANVFGTAVHGVLETIYKSFENKEIDTKVIGSHIGNIRKMLAQEFRKQISTLNIEKGKNMLLFEVANTQINNFLKWDIKNLKKNPTILISAEKDLEVILPDSNGIKLRGIIDRIDKSSLNGNVRVIDYKTGKVENKDLKVSHITELVESHDKSKAFQLLFYQLLLEGHHKNNNIESGIISTRNISNGFIPLVIEDESNQEECLRLFSNIIIDIISEIEDPKIPFVKTDDIDRCKFCNFKDICNR